MSARSVDASTPEGYAAALLLLHMRVTQFNLTAPASLTRQHGHSLSVQLHTNQMSAVDEWASALGLPAPQLDLAGKPYPRSKNRPAWREYGSVGVVDGIGMQVWCSAEVSRGEVPQ